MDFSEWHKRKLMEYLAESSDDPLKLCDTVKELRLLPLMHDMGGCFAIRSDGKIVSFPWDNHQEIREEDDLRIRNIALYQGSKKYPELQVLISKKTSDTRQCPHCIGTGIAPVPSGIKRNNFVCYCGGLGWIPGES